MTDFDFLKEVDEEIKQQEQEVQQTEDDKEATGWIDTETIMQELKKAAQDILYEHDPKLKDVVEKLKQEYEEVYVYFFSDNEFYIFRPLTRFEYKELLAKTTDTNEITDMIFKKAVLVPEMTDDKMNKLKAGVVPTIVEIVLKVSNFNNSSPVVKL